MTTSNLQNKNDPETVKIKIIKNNKYDPACVKNLYPQTCKMIIISDLLNNYDPGP